MRTRSLLWRREEGAGVEVSFVTWGRGRLTAVGSAIGSSPLPYRLSYSLEAEDSYVTRRCTATTEGLGWRRTLTLVRDASGRWTCDATTDGAEDMPAAGADVAALEGSPDVDIGFSPLTNSPPVQRAGLLTARPPVDIDAAWISVPDLAVSRLAQRYSFVRRTEHASVIRYETRDGSFGADLTFDHDGFVLVYPGLARLVS